MALRDRKQAGRDDALSFSSTGSGGGPVFALPVELLLAGRIMSTVGFLPRSEVESSSSSLDEEESASSSLVSIGLFSLSYISFCRRSSPDVEGFLSGSDVSRRWEGAGAGAGTGVGVACGLSAVSTSTGLGFSGADFPGVELELRALEPSHRFLGELERPSREEEESRESSEVPREVLLELELLPLVKLGKPTFRSRPDMTAAMAFLLCGGLLALSDDLLARLFKL